MSLGPFTNLICLKHPSHILNSIMTTFVWVPECLLLISVYGSFIFPFTHLIGLCERLHYDPDEGHKMERFRLTIDKLWNSKHWGFDRSWLRSLLHTPLHVVEVVPEPSLYHKHQKDMMKEVVTTLRRDRRRPRLQCVASLRLVKCGHPFSVNHFV